MFPELHIISVFLIVFTAATLGAMIGVGGGFLMVPLLTLLLRYPIHEAIALSLLSIVAIASSATITYSISRHIDYKIGILLETTTAIGAFVGANTSLKLPSNILFILFGCALIFVSYRMLAGIKFEAKEKKRISNIRLSSGVLASFIAGVLSGLLGIGGGIVKVPIMVLILGFPTKLAIGTSEFMISITSAVGSYVYYRAGIIEYMPAASAIIGAILGAQLGSRVGLKIKGITLRKIFGIVMLIFSIMMILKGLGYWV